MRRILIGSIGSLFALTVGCSDDPAPADASTTDVGVLDVGADLGAADAGSPDAGPRDVPVAIDVVDASTADVAPDRPSTDASDGGAACALTRALVTTTDFMNGGYGLGPIGPTPSLTVSGTMSPDQDHVPVESGCIVYNLLRSNDAIAVLDPAALPAIARRIPLRMMGTPGVDAGAPMPYSVNPYDVLTLSATRAVVVQYALPRLGVIDPSRDGAAGVIGSVDLTPLRAAADMDGSLEASNIVRVGGSLFVSLQNLNSFVPVTNGTIAVLNAADLTLVDADPATTGMQPVQLTGRDPVSMVTTPSGASIVVAEAGVVAFSPPQMLDGRIERVDPTTLRVTGMSVSETALGGDLGAVVMLDESRGWAIVSRLATGDASVADNRVVEFNLTTGTVGSTIFTGGSLAGIARDPSGNVWVLDRTTGSSGVRVFRPDGTALTTMALGTGTRAPYGIAFVP
jgi:hypothetical protein